MIDYTKPILDEHGNPIKMLESAAHHCIRCVKKARALKKIGYEIHGMGSRQTYGGSTYETYGLWEDERQFKNLIKMYIDMGVRAITWNNEPHIQSTWIKDVIFNMGVQDKVKLVVDCHDLEIVRQKAGYLEELYMFCAADGIIYVSSPIQKIVNKLYRVNVPNTVLYSYCNNDIIADYDESLIPNRKGLVYEGGANPPEDTTLNSIYSYRSLYNIIKRLVELGNEVHMYCGNATAYESYHTTGAVLYPPTDYDKMMLELTRFKWGILIFNNEDGQKDQVNLTLTNKESEYLMAGVPSIACWCPESQKHVKKHGTGISFEHIDEIRDCSGFEHLYQELMENIKIKRKELVMENYIVRVENLFAKLLGLEEKGIPDNISALHKFDFDE